MFGKIENHGAIGGDGKMIFYSENPNIKEQMGIGNVNCKRVFNAFYLNKKFDAELIDHFINKNSFYTDLVLSSNEKFNVILDRDLTIPKYKSLLIDPNGTLEVQKGATLTVLDYGELHTLNKPIINGNLLVI